MDLSRSRVALHCTFHGLIMELLRTNVFLETEDTEFKKWTNTVWTLAVERCAAVGAHSENDSQHGPLYPPCNDGRSSTALGHYRCMERWLTWPLDRRWTPKTVMARWLTWLPVHWRSGCV